MAIQDKFNKPNVIYKITKDINLEGGTLTIPEGCTLDFQGGSIYNGTVTGNNTKTLNDKFIDCVLSGTWYKGSEKFPYYTRVTYIQGRYLNEATGNKTTYWLTTIPNKDENGNFIRLKVGLANDNANGQLNTLESTVSFAHRKKATYCSNAILYNTTTKVPVGSLVVDGKILLNVGYPNSSSMQALGIKADNTLVNIMTEDTPYAQKALDAGCTDMIQGWYPFVIDGELYIDGRDDSDFHPRSAIGQKADKSLVFLQCNGRTPEDEGMNLKTMGEILLAEGCVFAYNLDGGGSTSGVYRGIKLNGDIDNFETDRAVAGYLYVVKEINVTQETELTDAYDEIQAARAKANKDLIQFRRANRITDANDTYWNGWYSIGNSFGNNPVNLPTYTNGNKMSIGAIVHLVDIDCNMNNSMQFCIDKEYSQMYARTFDSKGNAGSWGSATCPVVSSLPSRALKGVSVFPNSGNLPMWWNGNEWTTAMGTTRQAPFGDFYRQATSISDFTTSTDLGNGLFRALGPIPGAPTEDLKMMFLLNLRYEDSNPLGNKIQVLVARETAQLYYREIESNGTNITNWKTIGSPAYTTEYRPTKGLIAGTQVFDTTLGKPIWWNGTAWVDATGTTV